MSTIELNSLTKRFGDLTAVEAVDLDVGAGEVVCLLGPSGCGKTTTLRMIAGLERASSGEVFIDGRPVNRVPTRARNVAMVFQFYALYPTLTVRENLAYPLHAEKLDESESRQRVDQILEVLHLQEVAERLPGQLGEGEKQRVAVGRAIVRDPTCFLFDEPLSRLDVQLRETMRGQIKEVLTGLSKATVIVTHDQLEALTMADRIAVMRNGRIEQFDTPHQIFSAPANEFVAGFIGTPQMNLLEAQVVDIGDDLALRIGAQQMSLPDLSHTPTLAAGQNLTIGVRPRNLELVSSAGPATLSATVDLVEPMGAETLLHLACGDCELRVVTERDRAAREGAHVHVALRTDRVHMFDSAGERIRA